MLLGAYCLIRKTSKIPIFDRTANRFFVPRGAVMAAASELASTQVALSGFDGSLIEIMGSCHCQVHDALYRSSVSTYDLLYTVQYLTIHHT